MIVPTDVLLCPLCLSPMVLRTARRGSNAGSQFYGCSQYPRCKGTRDINVSTNVQSKPIVPVEYDDDDLSLRIPSTFLARERRPNYTVSFFQTIAVPEKILIHMNQGQIKKDSLLKYSQWRVDYPQINKYIAPEAKLVLLMAEKILTRGSVTLASPRIEEAIEAFFFHEYEYNTAIDLNVLNTDRHICDVPHFQHDGYGTERYFYEKIIPELLGKNSWRQVIPQVHLSSLVGLQNANSMQGQRIDFLVNIGDHYIIVEIDQEGHIEHQERDNERDKLLIAAGYEIIRIPNWQVQNSTGEKVELLQERLEPYKSKAIHILASDEKVIHAIKQVHQAELTIVELLLSGCAANLHIAINFGKNVWTQNEVLFLSEKVQEDINELLNTLSALYGNSNDQFSIVIMDDLSCDPEFQITWDASDNSFARNVYIADIQCPITIALASKPVPAWGKINTQEELLSYFLRYLFRKMSFLEGQYETISRALDQKDTLVLLPTGSGKSIAFQLSSLLLPGIGIVIEPIISLIDDQVENLSRMGIDRAIGISSEISSQSIKQRVLSLFAQGSFLLFYISPERFQTVEFRAAVSALIIGTPIPLVAIDEAHCVSEWGHDFRTAYLNIGRTCRTYCTYNNSPPCILALTGTASSAVLRDVQRELEIRDFEAIVTPKTFDRAELHYHVIKCRSSEKAGALEAVISRLLPDRFHMSTDEFYRVKSEDANCGVVFSLHVNGEYGVKQLADLMARKIQSADVKCYASTPPTGMDGRTWNKEKKRIATRFKNNKTNLLISTSAFGMGIDKPNVRFTVHYGIPKSIEAFYQEAGRAGRDRRHAECFIILSNDNELDNNKILDVHSTIDWLKEKSNNQSRTDADDISRALFFHLQAFKGINDEIDNIHKVINKLGLSKPNRESRNCVYSNMDRKDAEKAIHRLLLIGVVDDYTIDYASNEFHIELSGGDKQHIIDSYVKYVAGYNKSRVLQEIAKFNFSEAIPYVDFIVNVCSALISFIYDTVEKGRRRALGEMLFLADTAVHADDKDKSVRDRLLRYLESTHVEEIEQVLSGEYAGFMEVKNMIDGYETPEGELIGGIRSYKDAEEIRGQVARYLESTPDHPGLLLLRALSETYCRDCSMISVEQNMGLAYVFSKERYSLREDIIYEMLSWVMGKVFERNAGMYSELAASLLYEINDDKFAKSLVMLARIDTDIAIEPTLYLYGRINNKVCDILKINVEV